MQKNPRNPQSAHRSADGIDLHQIFCWEFERGLSNDWCISFGGEHYQIEKRYGDVIRPRSKIIVRKHLNGTITFWYKGKALVAKMLPAKPESSVVKIEKHVMSRSMVGKLARQSSSWGRYNPNWLKNKKYVSNRKLFAETF